MAEHPKWMDVDLPRPEGLAADVPWPARIRYYPPDHPARSRVESKVAFNWDWAVEDFGEAFLNRLKAKHEELEKPFKGDWWVLALLRRCEEAARARDPKREDSARFSPWDRVLGKLFEVGVGFHLEHANLRSAHLEHANLIAAHLEYADLISAHLEHADLSGAHLEHACLHEAHLEYASLLEAHLEDAHLEEAVLTGADVRWAKSLRFDDNRVRDIHIEGNAPDPWSVLRRGYTGPLFFVHAALLVAFILPYVAKVLALTGADHAFPLKDGTRATISTSAGVWDVVVGPNPPAWRVLIGLEEGWWVPAIGAILLVYNAIRAVLTIKVGQLRDAEERSGITPTFEEYMGTQGFEDESGWRALWNVIRESWRWLAAAGVALATGCLAMHFGLRGLEQPIGAPLASLVVVFGGAAAAWVTWLVTSSIFLGKLHLKPTLIDVQPVGLWRLHRLLKALLVIALTSFAVHAVHWVWTTTLPRITVTPAGQAIEPAPSPAPASPPVATPPAEPPVLPMESATP